MRVNLLLNKMKQRIIKGVFSGAFGQAVTIAIQLISIPLFLSQWGIELYGEWLILSSIPTYLALSDIGLPTTAGNAIAMLTGSEYDQKKLEIYQSTWVMVTSLSFIILCLFVLSIYYFKVYELTNIKTIPFETFYYTIILLLIHVVLCFQSGVLKIAYRAIKKNPFGDFLNYITRLLEWICASGAVFFYSKGVFEVAACFVIVRFFSNIIQWLILKINKNKLLIGIKYFKFETVIELLKPSISTMMFPLGLAMTLQGMILIIGHILNPESVVLFNIYRTLTRITVQVITVINQSIWPEISYAFAEKKIDVVKKLTKNSQNLCLFFGSIMLFCLYFLNEIIIDFWLNKTVLYNNNLLNLLLLSTLIHIVWQPFWVAQMALNMHIIFSYLFVVISLMSAVSSYFLINEFDILGAGLSIVLTEIVFMMASCITLKIIYKNISQ